MKPNIGIDDKNRGTVVRIFDTVLSDEYVLYTKTRNFHWNVVGRNSMTDHEALVSTLRTTWKLVTNNIVTPAPVIF